MVKPVQNPVQKPVLQEDVGEKEDQLDVVKIEKDKGNVYY